MWANCLQVCDPFHTTMLHLTFAQGVVVFHAGTSKSGEDIVSSGGRVLAVTAHAPTLQQALDTVYAGVDKVTFDGKTYRRDIAHR
jgi:phosphoribosylamine--glycine ligase / phosphoribosylformylglycinamidine cyclo-ligase